MDLHRAAVPSDHEEHCGGSRTPSSDTFRLTTSTTTSTRLQDHAHKHPPHGHPHDWPKRDNPHDP